MVAEDIRGVSPESASHNRVGGDNAMNLRERLKRLRRVQFEPLKETH
jgi:hypothetical protein